jgi:hypothetical protein
MPTSTFTSAQIAQLKLAAKHSTRADNIPHSEALDQAAHGLGFSNWSLLMKNAGPADDEPLLKYLRFSRVQEDMRLALHKVKAGRYDNRIDLAKDITKNICADFGSALNAVDFSIDYIKCLLTVPRYSINSACPVFWELRCWLPYKLIEVNDNKQVLVNRRYKPVGTVSDEWVNYEDFGHLATELSISQLKQIAHKETSEGYLFNDGCAPWYFRKDAEAYLTRLLKLQAFLKR